MSEMTAIDKTKDEGRFRRGLSSEEVRLSREKYGENTLTRQKKKSFFKQYLAAFSDPIIRVLLIALFVNVLMALKSKNVTETIGVAIAVFLSTFVSTLSEYGSGAAFEKMTEESENAVCKAVRDGKTVSIEAKQLVVGDLLLLQAGDRVPVDAVMVSGELTVSQSPLTGESAEIIKTPYPSGKETGFLRREKVFCGSLVTSGEGYAVAEAVGEKTFYGRMASELKAEKDDSPLKKKLAKLARTLSLFGYVAAVSVALADLFNAFFIDNRFNGAPIRAMLADPMKVISCLTHAATLAVAVVVVAVPEGLPMMIAVVLSSQRAKMARDHVLVKRAAGIEAAGGMQILFTDKTGTLTYGEPIVSHIVIGDGTAIKTAETGGALRDSIAASVRYNGGEDGGNATSRALFRAFLKNEGEELADDGCSSLKSKGTGAFAPLVVGKAICRVKFRTENKYAAVLIEDETSRACAYLQGAPEKVVGRCAFYTDGREIFSLNRQKILSCLHERTRRGKRVVAIALKMLNDGGMYKTEARLKRLAEEDEKWVFVCLACCDDELRKEARDAVENLRKAGVQTVMVTGDHPETAAAIAKEVGLFSPVCRGKRGGGKNAEKDGDYVVLTAEEMATLGDERLCELLPRLRVVARALPTDKSRLIALAKKSGFVVGMTGDGINDAAALKKADVGFALGSGTQVAKEAADVVLTDDNLSSVVSAAAYGRHVFKSIRRFVVFQLTMNLCAAGISLIAPFFAFDTPITVMQMLWINLIMDTLASLAFAGVKLDPADMRREPIPLSEPVLTKRLCLRAAATGAYCIALCLLMIVRSPLRDFFAADGESALYAAFFATFVFSGLFGAFHARTDEANVFANMRGSGSFVAFIALTSFCQTALVYFGGSLFRTVPLSAAKITAAVALSATVLPFGALVKRAEKVFDEKYALSPRKRRASRKKAVLR